MADFKIELKHLINAFLIKADLETYSITDDQGLSQGLLDLEKANHEWVASLYDTLFQMPSFFRICGDKKTAQVIKWLLAMDQTHPLYGFTNRCRIDPPQDNRRTYGWHQEVFYTIPQGRYIQTWAPLIFDTTIHNGTIEVAAGSHKEHIASQTWHEIDGRATQILVDDAVIQKYPTGAVPMKMGELLFFSGYLAHRSGQNTSEQVRYSLVGMYHDIMHVPFQAPKLHFDYRGATPRRFYESVFGASR